MARTILFSLIAAIAAVFAVNVASAHAGYVSSDPAPGSVLAAAPARVTIQFNENLARGTDITVKGPSGATVSTSDTTFTGMQASVALQPAGNGVYTVNWTSVSADDGDQESDSFQFGVGVPAGTVAPQTGTGMASGMGTGWAPVLGALAILLSGAVLVRARGRDRSQA